ncbi:MAG: DUF456 domain-containing protein [Bacillota bacterium]
MGVTAQVIAFSLAVIVMLVGVVGTFFPAIPGLPLIWLAMLGYGFFEGFREMTLTFLAVTLLVVAATQVAEHYARAWGAQRFGAGRAGAWGAVIGSIAGLFFMPLGLVLGPFLGAMLFELVAGRPGKEAVRAGVGGLVGVLGSVVVNVIVALSLTIAFILKVLI